MKYRYYNIEYVEWVDSVASHEGWTLIQEMDADASMRAFSVGLLIKETKQYVQLVANWHPETNMSGDTVARFSADGDMSIPKCAIVKRKVLKRVRVREG